jgi:hypothetical protein
MTQQYSQELAVRWPTLSLAEQLANVGADFGRAIRWREKKNFPYADAAFSRTLELLDLTIEAQHSSPRGKELITVRKVLVDFFKGDNVYHSSAEELEHYFLAFNFEARRNHY